MVDIASYDKLYIGGAWVQPSSSSVFQVISPTTGELLGSAPEGLEADMDAAIAAARDAFDNGPWPQMPAADRADAMQRLLDGINANADELAQLITAEIGAPLLFSHFGQVGATAMALDYYVNLTRTFEFESVRPGMLGPVLVRKEGVGVCAGIIPWNVPLFIMMLKLAPALASGSTIVRRVQIGRAHV